MAAVPARVFRIAWSLPLATVFAQRETSGGLTSARLVIRLHVQLAWSDLTIWLCPGHGVRGAKAVVERNCYRTYHRSRHVIVSK